MWHSLPIEKILEEFKTDAQNGLFDVEVKKRLKDFGPNQLPEEKPISKIRLLIGQLKSPLIYILVIAGIVTLILKEYADSIIIFGVVFLNAIIGYFQESKAGQTIQALRKMIRVKAIVFRQGEEREIFQEELVPGDIILLRPGDKVPADGRLIDAWNLKLNEAVLTGEWLPSEKNTEILPKDTPLADRDNMVYMGTVVEYGRGKAVVTATGIKTEIGKIAQTLKGTKAEKTPYQKKVVHFSKVLGAIIVFLCLGILIGGLATGKEFFEIFLTAIAVAVAAIPEGLPVAVTLVFTFGMREIFKKKGLVRKLIAAETLGSTTVICTDKTGTLTEAKMQVAGIYTGTKELLSNGKRF
ncbi:MAG: ATPase, partial [Parcubacteria group bacterium CG08_land_8_20_14_0_20_38_56]